MHINFIKTVLGVKLFTNTNLIYAETGQFPLYITICRQLMKYWLKLTCTRIIDILLLPFMHHPLNGVYL